MTPQALIVLIAWFPLTLFFFSRYSPRTACLLGFIGGLLFLPQRTGIDLPLIPDYTGITAACYGIFIGMLCFDIQCFRRFKPNLLDIPMLIWCISPIFSSLANGLGLYDGINTAFTQSGIWGMPYFVGRLYFSSLTGTRELALAIIKGGLIYIPFCLFEIRMSPQIHFLVYGFHPHDSGLAQAIRLGGWRPQVFMSHGLVLAMWMMMVTLIAIWSWKAGTFGKIFRLPVAWVVIILLITFILIKSTGAYFYLLLGTAILFTGLWSRKGILLYILIAAIVYYLYSNLTGGFNSETVMNFLEGWMNPDRLQSLQFRYDNENLLKAKAIQKMIFGWGGWGRSRIFEENWEGDIVDISVTDSLWIIAFGTTGLVGLTGLFASLLLPPLVFVRRYGAKLWNHPRVAPAIALTVCLVLFALDCLFNFSFNAIFPLTSGALVGLAMQKVTANPGSRKVPSPRLPRKLGLKPRRERRLFIKKLFYPRYSVIKCFHANQGSQATKRNGSAILSSG